MKSWNFSILIIPILLTAPLRATASMQKGYPQSEFCFDIELRSGNTGECRAKIAGHYPGTMEEFTNGSFFNRSTYAQKHKRKASGWNAIGLLICNGEEMTACPSGHHRGVLVQSTVVWINYWDEIKDHLPKVINFATNQFEPYVLCAVEGNLLMKSGNFVADAQGFSRHHRKDPHRRPVAALKANGLFYLSYMYGTNRQIYNHLKRAGFADAITFDSGSSTAKNARVLNIIGIVSKKSDRYSQYLLELDSRGNWTRLLKPAKDGKPAKTPFGDVIFPTKAFTLS